MDLRGLFGLVPLQLTWAALGVQPWLTSFMLVELPVLAVPAWRALRLRPPGRAKLNKIAVGLGICIAAMQAWFHAGGSMP